MEAFEKLIDLQGPEDLRLSPDGTKIVYSSGVLYGHRTGEHSISTIWIADVGKGKSARQLTSGLFNDRSPIWAPDGASIFFLSDRKEASKKDAIYHLNLAGGEPVPLSNLEHEKPISRLSVSPDGKHLVFLRAAEDTPEKKKKAEEKNDSKVWGEDWEHGQLNVLHIATRTTETLVKGDYHIFEAAWSPDSKKIAYVFTPTPEVESAFFDGAWLKTVEIATKNITDVCKFEHAPWTDYKPIGIQWKGDHIYAPCNAVPGTENSSACLIYSIALKDGKFKRELGGDTYCCPDLRVCGDTFVAHTEHGMHTEVRDASGKVLFRELCNLDGISAVEVDGQKVIAIVKSTASKAPEVFTFTTASPEPVQVSAHGDGFPEVELEIVEINTKSLDGTTDLQGVFFGPKSAFTNGKPTKPLPTFVQPHGGPYWRNTSQFWCDIGFNQTLNRAGYGFLAPSYRGTSGRGADFAAPYTMGKFDHDDCIALTDAIVKQGLADKDRLAVGGWSQGGGLTYLSATRNGKHNLGWKWKAAVAGAGFCDNDLLTMTNDCPRMEAELSTSAPWDREIDDIRPRRNGAAIWEFKAAAAEGRIPPMLLLHGEDDARVPVTQARTWQLACRLKGIPCTMVTYPRCPHMPGERNVFLDLHRRLLKFVDTHIG